MSKKLGIYLDVNAIGWTLFDTDQNKISHMGVHRFNPGCENFGWGKREQSKKKSKRVERLHRVRYARIRTRKFYLMRLLVEHRMCPTDLEALKTWKNEKIFPHNDLDAWLSMNPYALRVKGLSDKLSLYELGRILYQMAQHRGYRFGERQSMLKANILYKGRPEEGKIGFDTTRRALRGNTLGEYLYDLLPRENQSYVRHRERVRNRICSTQMYFDEIHSIWEMQMQFYHFKEGLRDLLIGSPDDHIPGGALFFQRPLKSQKHKVGNCILEPQKTRACVSSLEYQEVEARKWINTIQYNNQPLTAEDREKAYHFLQCHYRFRFSALKKRLNLPDAKGFNYLDEETFKGIFIHSELSKNKYFGKQWFSLDKKQQEDIFHALYFFNDTEKLKYHAMDTFGLDEYNSTQFSKISLDKSYAMLSKKACRNLIPFLRRGFRYKTAVYLGGIKNAFGSQWENLSTSDREDIIQQALNHDKNYTNKEVHSKFQDWIKIAYPQLKFHAKKAYGLAIKTNQKKRFKRFEISKEADKEIL